MVVKEGLVQTVSVWLRRVPTFNVLRITGLTLSIAILALTCRGQVTTTAVQDTVYHADGTYATGTILVTWPAFVTSSGNTVAAGNISVTIGTNGQVSLNLAPNIGAMPAGSYYTAVYHLDDGTVSKEYWEIPNVPSTSIAAIRSLVMPASIAVQTITATQVNSMLSQYLPLKGGTLSGALQLQGDPQSAMQASTKNYVDNAISPLATAVTQAVTTTPKNSQVIQQPLGTNLASNILQGKYYASNFATGNQSNGISNITSSSNCSNSTPSGLSGCTVYVEPTYSNAENPQGYLYNNFGNNTNNMQWSFNTHVHDERNGITADYYENPLSVVPQQSAAQTITANFTLGQQSWPAYTADNLSAEQLSTTDYEGGYNFYNYFGYNQFPHFFKAYYGDLNVSSTNYSSGQLESINNYVNCHGTGDCLGMTQSVVCDGGMNASDDEGCHGGDWNVSEDPDVYKGVVTSAAPVGATVVYTNGTAGQGTQGQDRLLVDTNAADIISGNSITGYTGAEPTGPSGNSAINPDSAQDSNANYPISTMVQLCYPGSDNGGGGPSGCTAGSQPVGYIPSAANMINPVASVTTNVVASYAGTSAPQTGLPSGFCTPSTLQSTTPSAACYLPTTGTACLTDQEEYESVNYTYNSSTQQITLLNLRFPHLNGMFFAHGGLCGYAVEQQSDIFTGDGQNNGVSQVFPVEGSPNSTSFYYISQRVNEGYSQPILGVSNDIDPPDNGGSSGGECFTLNISYMQLQSDGKTVLAASNVPFNSGFDLSPINGMTLSITTPNSTYNGNYVTSYGVLNDNGNEFSYVLPVTPTGTTPATGTASFCNTNYKLYPAVRVNSVYNESTHKVDGTMNTMPSPVAFASNDTVMEPHYPWIYTGHDLGRGVNQYLPRFYQGGYLYGMTYNYLLSGSPFIGFQIKNGTDQNRYLEYGGTHIPPGSGFNLSGEWSNDFYAGQPGESAVIEVGACKPSPIGCNNAKSPFNVLLMPTGNEALNFDPESETWTFGNVQNYAGNPPVPNAGTVQVYNLNVKGSCTGCGSGVYLPLSGGNLTGDLNLNFSDPLINLTDVAGGSYAGFHLDDTANGGQQWAFYTQSGSGDLTIGNNTIGISTQAWYEPDATHSYAILGEFGAEAWSSAANANDLFSHVDTFLSRCSTNCLEIGNALGASNGTFTAGTVNASTLAASTSVATPSLNVGGGSAVTHVAYYTTGSITPTAVASQSCSDQTFTVSGLTITDDLGSIHPPAALGNLSINGYASAANTVTLHFCNVSSTSLAAPAGAYTFLAMH